MAARSRSRTRSGLNETANADGTRQMPGALGAFALGFVAVGFVEVAFAAPYVPFAARWKSCILLVKLLQGQACDLG